MATKPLPSALKRISEIGRGGFGIVHFGYYRGNQEVAIKDIPGHLPQDALNEAQMLKRLTHRNIIQYIDVIVQTTHTSLVMTYIDKGNLNSYINQTTPCIAYWKTTRKILMDVAQGMNYLHSQRVVHADLKSLNVLLRHDYDAVICDFGLDNSGRRFKNPTH